MVTAQAPRREWRIKKLARLGVYCAVVSLGIGLLAARSVYGDVASSALSIGHELGKMEDAGKRRPLRINGEAIYVGAVTVDTPVVEVLDRAEAGCRSRSAGAVRDLDGVPESVRAHLPQGSAASGVLRENRLGRGVVACLVRDDDTPGLGLKDLTARLSALAGSGDLAEVGRLRYVFAETTASGRTRVVSAWTEGSFNLYAILPKAGSDAPGTDAADAPRPPRAQRILSADIEGVPYGVRLYDTPASPAEVIGVYDREMAGRGWEPAFGTPGDGPDQRAYTRPGADLMVITSKDGERTVVSVIETRGR
jgi:hypothetical protein